MRIGFVHRGFLTNFRIVGQQVLKIIKENINKNFVSFNYVDLKAYFFCTSRDTLKYLILISSKSLRNLEINSLDRRTK